MKCKLNHVCFDLDNTLVDDSGFHLRPGMRELLASLARQGVRLSLWTASTEYRAVELLRWHRLANCFGRCIFRDDYDPEGAGLPKDIRFLHADMLVDDRWEHIEFVRQTGKMGFHISPFTHPRQPVSLEELQALHELTVPGVPWP